LNYEIKGVGNDGHGIHWNQSLREITPFFFVTKLSFILMNAEADEWNGIIGKVMEVDNSWNNTAGKYVDVYNSVRVRL
jgi:glycogen synthase